MKKLPLILSLVILSLLSSGCSPKEPKVVYVKAPTYDFQTIDFNGSGIQLKEKEEICKPIVIDIINTYAEVKAFYDEQIKDYKRINKESK